jgi:hypothetical protein
MNLWNKINDFFKPKPVEYTGAAAAAAAAADILLYVKNLITRPDRAKDLIARVEKFQVLRGFEKLEEFIPLYLDLEKYIIDNEPIKKFTKESLRLEVYIALNLENSKISLIGFFTPGIKGAIMLVRELLSKWIDSEINILGNKKVEEVILDSFKGTVFEGVEYTDGVLDFSYIQSRLESDIKTDKEFKKVFNEINDTLEKLIVEIRGSTPRITIRKKILDEWILLKYSDQPAWQMKRINIPITSKAKDMILSIGMGELIKSGTISELETKLIPKGSDEIPVRVSASVLKNEEGDIQGMVISAKDLSEIRRLEAEKIRILENAKAGAEAEVLQRTQELEQAKKELEKSLTTEKATTQQLRAAQQQQTAANQQLAAAQQNLQDKLLELERFNKVAVGRELKMIELKEEVARLRGTGVK